MKEKLERVLKLVEEFSTMDKIEFILNSFRGTEIGNRCEIKASAIQNKEIAARALVATLQDQIYTIRAEDATAQKIKESREKTQSLIAEINAIDCTIGGVR